MSFHYLLQIGILLFHHLRDDFLAAYQSKQLFEFLDSPFPSVLSDRTGYLDYLDTKPMWAVHCLEPGQLTYYAYFDLEMMESIARYKECFMAHIYLFHECAQLRQLTSDIVSLTLLQVGLG